jgi:hypothetical protein
MLVHCIQTPVINRMHSQAADSSVWIMVLIATATHNASVGGRNETSECDFNAELPYFKF